MMEQARIDVMLIKDGRSLKVKPVHLRQPPPIVFTQEQTKHAGERKLTQMMLSISSEVGASFKVKRSSPLMQS